MKITAVIILLVGLCFSSSSGRSLKPNFECPTGVVSWNPSPCVHCTCVNEVAQCSIRDCAVPSCLNAMHVVPPGECCPICPNGVQGPVP